MIKKIPLILICTALILTGCGILPVNSSGNMNGTTWTLLSYDGKTLITGTAMTAIFEDGQVSGSASCNHYFGSYKTKGDQIEIDGMGWTEMACMDPEGIMEQEQHLMSLLSQAEAFFLEGQELQITTSSGEILIFRKTETND